MLDEIILAFQTAFKKVTESKLNVRLMPASFTGTKSNGI